MPRRWVIERFGGELETAGGETTDITGNLGDFFKIVSPDRRRRMEEQCCKGGGRETLAVLCCVLEGKPRTVGMRAYRDLTDQGRPMEWPGKSGLEVSLCIFPAGLYNESIGGEKICTE